MAADAHQDLDTADLDGHVFAPVGDSRLCCPGPGHHDVGRAPTLGVTG